MSELSSLILVGIGLNQGDVSQSAKEAVESCDRIFCEAYTSLFPDMVESIGRLFGRPMTMLNRAEVEEGSVLMKALSEGDVALLVPGDPMISTTHISLRVQAARSGHESRIIHSSSIISAAIGESCLQATRFGRMATISFHHSLQPYDVLGENLVRNLHTLFLLDIDSEHERYMSIRQALESLLATEESEGRGFINDETLVVGLARISNRDQLVRAGQIREIRKFDFGPPPHSLVVPGELHFAESEALQVLLQAKF